MWRWPIVALVDCGPVSAGTIFAMERESTKHSPRLDDEMAREVASLTTGAPVEARTREDRVKEAPSEDEPGSEVGGRPDLPQVATISPAQADARAELARHLAGASFPATGPELVATARSQGASQDLVAELGRLPGHIRFDTVEQVWEATGGRGEPPLGHGTRP